MLGQDISVIEAEIQAQIAEFLILKKKLLALKTHPVAEIQDRAKVLYNVQEYLEGKLTNILAMLQRAKTGDVSASDIAEAVAFAYSVRKQVDDVKDLEKKAGYIPSTASVFPVALAAAMGIGLGLLLLKRR